MMKLGRLTVEDSTGVARLRKRRRGSRFRQTKRDEPVARLPSDGPALLTGAARNAPEAPASGFEMKPPFLSGETASLQATSIDGEPMRHSTGCG